MNNNPNFGNPIMNKFNQNQIKNPQQMLNPNMNIPSNQMQFQQQFQQQFQEQQDLQKNISSPNQTQIPNTPIEDKNDININYLNSLEDDESKKEYLGEIIFKKIENHPLSQKFEFSINKIGKTTGMILAIDDINYIMDICKNEEMLSGYIKEAQELLKESEK